MPTHILVTAPEGRMTPIASGDAAGVNGIPLYVTPAIAVRVRYSSDIRRAIKRGDLSPCKPDGSTCGLADADAPVATGVPIVVTDEIQAANRRHRQAPPSARPPLPDEAGPQGGDRRNRPAPSHYRPTSGPPKTTIIPDDDEPLSAAAHYPTMDASAASSFDTSDAGSAGKGL